MIKSREEDLLRPNNGENPLKFNDLIAMREQITNNKPISKGNPLTTLPKRIFKFSKIKLKNLKMNKIISYTLVSQEETDLKNGKISISSPVGKGLVGHKVGDIVEIDVPAGKLRFEILEIS